MCRRLHAFGASMLVILQLAFATGASCGLTLCIEADGRGVIESALSPGCCGQPQDDVSANQIACDCSDIPLLENAAAVTVGLRELVPPLSAALPARVLDFAAASVRTELRPTSPADHGDSVDSGFRRTIVLLV